MSAQDDSRWISEANRTDRLNWLRQQASRGIARRLSAQARRAAGEAMDAMKGAHDGDVLALLDAANHLAVAADLLINVAAREEKAPAEGEKP